MLFVRSFSFIVFFHSGMPYYFCYFYRYIYIYFINDCAPGGIKSVSLLVSVKQ